MKRKLLSLAAALLMLAGCSASGPASPEAADTVPEIDNMIFAVLPHATVRYEGYRRFLDVAEGTGRIDAGERLAYTALMEQELFELGQPFSQEAFEAETAPILEAAAQDGFFQEVERALVRDFGLTREQVFASLQESYRFEYMTFLLQEQFSAQALQNGSDPWGMIVEYQSLMESRAGYSESGGALILDGKEIPLTEEQKVYLTYCGAVSRIRAMNTIAVQAAARLELLQQGVEPVPFPHSEMDDLIQAIETTPELASLHHDVLSRLGIDKEEYYRDLEKVLNLESGYYQFMEFCTLRYEELAAQNEAGLPASAEDYFDSELDRLTRRLIFLNTNPNLNTAA